jgi:20S proteasome subunit alpha 7
MIANYDDESGPQLQMIEPAGTVYKYFACAAGKGKQGAKTELEKIKFDTITCREAVDKISEIIYKLHDDVKDKEFELELSWVCNESNRKHVMVPANLKAEAIKKAVAAKEKAEMEDSDDEGVKPAVVHTPTNADDTPPVIEEHSDEEPPME